MMDQLSAPPAAGPTRTSHSAGLLAVARRRGGWVLLGLIIGILAAGLYATSTAVTYSSEAKVTVRAVATDPFQAGVNTNASISMDTEKDIASSSAVAQAAAALMNSADTPAELLRHVTVVNPPNTQILSISFAASSKAVAVAGANSFANAYLSNRQATITGSAKNITRTISSQISALNTQRAKIAAQLITASGANKDTLGSQRSLIDTQLAALQARLDQLASLDTTPGTVTQLAASSGTPSSSNKQLLVLGALLGLIVGLVLARVREGSDRRVWAPEDAAAILHSPLLNDRALEPGGPGLATETSAAGSSEGSEVFRAAALLLDHQLVSVPTRVPGSAVLGVVSARPGEGRTQVTAQLSVAMSDIGRDTRAVSADLVRPALHTVFGTPMVPGLIEAVQSSDGQEVPAPEDINGLAEVRDNLHVLPSGDLAAGRQRLLSLLSRVTQPLLAGPTGSVTLVDTPALFEVSDTLNLLGGLDCVVVVVVVGRSRIEDVERLGAALASFHVPVIGVLALKASGSRWRSRSRRRARVEATVPA